MSGERPFIVVGDKTDHGGEVLEGSPKALINGKMIARVGDKVHCPRSSCRGTQTITEGNPAVIVDGSAAAFHGGLTSCGAKLIATNVDNTMGGSAASLPPERDWSVIDRALEAANQSFTPLQDADGKPVMFADTSAKPIPVPDVPKFDHKRSGVTLIERSIPSLGIHILGMKMEPVGHEFIQIDPRDPTEVLRYIEAKTGRKPRDYFEIADPMFHRNDELHGGHKPLILSAHPEPGDTNLFNTGNSRLVATTNFGADKTGRSYVELEAPDYTKIVGHSLGYADDSVFNGNLILAYEAYVAKYPGGARYDAAPTGVEGRSGGQYNSNSYISGLLKAAGYDLENLPDPDYLQPGRSAPVPIPYQYLK